MFTVGQEIRVITKDNNQYRRGYVACVNDGEGEDNTSYDVIYYPSKYQKHDIMEENSVNGSRILGVLDFEPYDPKDSSK